MRNKIKAEIIKTIKDELGGTTAEIESVVESQFQFIAYTMSKGLFDSVRMPYFGRFKVNPYRLRKLNLYKAKSK